MNRPRILFLSLKALVLAPGAFAAQAQNDSTNGQFIIKEVRIGKLPLLASFQHMVSSPDLQHFAFPVMRQEQCVWRDGVEGPIFQAIKLLKFSPDSKRLAYYGRRDGLWQYVDDEGPKPAFDGISHLGFFFSPDGKHVVYGAKRADKFFIVLDGKEGAGFESLSAMPVFSPDSQRMAYGAVQDGKVLLIVDGKERMSSDGIVNDGLEFSPDSKHFACIAERGGKGVLVFDETEKPVPNNMRATCLTISPDGGRIAYMANSKDGKWHLVVNGKRMAEYDGFGERSLVFSPDSRRLAYAANHGTKCVFVVDGKESPAWDGVMAGGIVFSPDSRRVAYSAQRGGHFSVVLDGKEGATFDSIGEYTLKFSPDSKHFAYVGIRKGRHIAVVDGAESEEFDWISKDSPFFSPDSRHFTYAAGVSSGNGCFVVDGIKTGSFDARGEVKFETSKLIRGYSVKSDDNFDLVLFRIEIKLPEK